MKREMISIGVGAALLLASADALAQDAGFGQAGQISIQGDFQLSITSTSVSAPKGPSPDSVTTIVLGPALDYFVIDNLSVGGQLSYTSQSSGGVKLSGFTIGPRVGYDILINSKFSIWPRGGFSFFTGSADAANGSVSESRFSLVAFVPFLFHPAPHFFLGLGPVFTTDLSASFDSNDADKQTTFGLTSVVGGWF